MAEIVIRNLRKEFGDFTAVQSSSFKIEDGEFCVFVGPSGIAPWETLEMRAALRAAVQDPARRVIPVLLPHAPETGLPAFLSLFTWVDLRSEPDDGFYRLVSGIQGQRG